ALSQVVALPGGGLRGRVLVDGMPASAGEVLVRIPGGGEQLLAVQEDGRFATYLVPAGSFEFSIAIPGFLIWESVTMTSDGLSFIEYGDIAVSRAGLLEGVVENLPPGGGFKVRYIELYDSQGALLNSFPLENSPRFRFVDLTPGSYRLVVKIGIRPLIEEIVQVVPGKNFHKMAL
ncbi:MAG: hypothetical protein MK213_07885, partial [Planctomycetes bacterium]|nr:hypothetical protein [Planctomycetota bacterium]